MAHIAHGLFSFSKGALVGGAVVVGAALLLVPRKRNGTSVRVVQEEARELRETSGRSRDGVELPEGRKRHLGLTLAWLVMFSLASTAALLADAQLKKLREHFHV